MSSWHCEVFITVRSVPSVKRSPAWLLVEPQVPLYWLLFPWPWQSTWHRESWKEGYSALQSGNAVPCGRSRSRGSWALCAGSQEAERWRLMPAAFPLLIQSRVKRNGCKLYSSPSVKPSWKHPWTHPKAHFQAILNPLKLAMKISYHTLKTYVLRTCSSVAQLGGDGTFMGPSKALRSWRQTLEGGRVVLSVLHSLASLYAPILLKTTDDGQKPPKMWSQISLLPFWVVDLMCSATEGRRHRVRLGSNLIFLCAYTVSVWLGENIILSFVEAWLLVKNQVQMSGLSLDSVCLVYISFITLHYF